MLPKMLEWVQGSKGSDILQYHPQAYRGKIRKQNIQYMYKDNYLICTEFQYAVLHTLEKHGSGRDLPLAAMIVSLNLTPTHPSVRGIIFFAYSFSAVYAPPSFLWSALQSQALQMKFFYFTVSISTHYNCPFFLFLTIAAH